MAIMVKRTFYAVLQGILRILRFKTWLYTALAWNTLKQHILLWDSDETHEYSAWERKAGSSNVTIGDSCVPVTAWLSTVKESLIYAKPLLHL
jgi:hypothetical protein